MDALVTFPSPSSPALQPIDDLAAAIAAPAANSSAATCRWPGLLAEFDRREGWVGWGIKSCAHWLNWRCGIDLCTARGHVRVAHALAMLPAIAADFARGALSYSKVRAMTRIATAENEDYLLMIARHGTAAHVEALVRGYRRSVRLAEVEQANAAHAARAVHWHRDDDGMLVLHVRLPAEQGALVLKALEGSDAQLGCAGTDSASAR